MCQRPNSAEWLSAVGPGDKLRTIALTTAFDCPLYLANLTDPVRIVRDAIDLEEVDTPGCV